MREHRYYVYIVASRSRTLYIGFTSRNNCNRLVYLERYQDVHRAIAREKELKGWLRKRKIELIESTNPAWEDLSADWGKPIELYSGSA